jgi:hypothetical protein
MEQSFPSIVAASPAPAGAAACAVPIAACASAAEAASAVPEPIRTHPAVSARSAMAADSKPAGTHDFAVMERGRAHARDEAWD